MINPTSCNTCIQAWMGPAYEALGMHAIAASVVLRVIEHNLSKPDVSLSKANAITHLFVDGPRGMG